MSAAPLIGFFALSLRKSWTAFMNPLYVGSLAHPTRIMTGPTVRRSCAYAPVIDPEESTATANAAAASHFHL